jgi:hypothetical protein
MPMKSQAQRGAMYAAKAGKSTLGIPKSVGAEFVKSDTGGKLPKRKKDTRNYAKGGPVFDFDDQPPPTSNPMGDFSSPVSREYPSSFGPGSQPTGPVPSTSAPANEPPPQDVPDAKQKMQTG